MGFDSRWVAPPQMEGSPHAYKYYFLCLAYARSGGEALSFSGNPYWIECQFILIAQWQSTLNPRGNRHLVDMSTKNIGASLIELWKTKTQNSWEISKTLKQNPTFLFQVWAKLTWRSCQHQKFCQKVKVFVHKIWVKVIYLPRAKGKVLALEWWWPSFFFIDSHLSYSYLDFPKVGNRGLFSTRNIKNYGREREIQNFLKSNCAKWNLDLHKVTFVTDTLTCMVQKASKISIGFHHPISGNSPHIVGPPGAMSWRCDTKLANSRGEPAVSYKWTGWVWEITSWSSRLQENYRPF